MAWELLPQHGDQAAVFQTVNAMHGMTFPLPGCQPASLLGRLRRAQICLCRQLINFRAAYSLMTQGEVSHKWTVPSMCR